ncbi:MAG: hypothetical protein ABL927_01310 [Bdellovibrionales bacterium]
MKLFLDFKAQIITRLKNFNIIVFSLIFSGLIAISFLFQNCAAPLNQYADSSSMLADGFPFAYDALQIDYVAYTSCSGVNNAPASAPGIFTFRAGTQPSTSTFPRYGGLKFNNAFWTQIYNQTVPDAAIVNTLASSPSYQGLQLFLESGYTPKSQIRYDALPALSSNLIANMRKSGSPGNAIQLIHPNILLEQDFSNTTELNLQPLLTEVSNNYLKIEYYQPSLGIIVNSSKRGFKFVFSGRLVAGISEYDISTVVPNLLGSTSSPVAKPAWECKSYPIVENKDLYSSTTGNRLDNICIGAGSPGSGALTGWTLIPSTDGTTICAVPPANARCYPSTPNYSNLSATAAIHYVSICTRQ